MQMNWLDRDTNYIISTKEVLAPIYMTCEPRQNNKPTPNLPRLAHGLQQNTVAELPRGLSGTDPSAARRAPHTVSTASTPNRGIN